MKQIYIKRGCKIIAFALLIILLDQFVGFLYTRMRNSSTNYSSIDYNKAMYAIDKVQDEVIIVGSSEVNRDYNSKIIEMKLNKTCANLGRAKVGFWWEYMIIKAIFNRYTPKILIWDIGISPLSQKLQDDCSDYPFIGRYIDTNVLADSLINNSRSNQLKYLSSAYKFNSYLLDYLRILYYDKKPNSIKGYNAIYDEMRKDFKVKDCFLSEEVNYKTKEKYAEVITYCMKRGCTLFCVFSPKYKKYYSKLNPEFKQMCDSLGCKYFDFSQQELFLQNPTFFFDELHLNDKGATLFTKMLLDSLVVNGALN